MFWNCLKSSKEVKSEINNDKNNDKKFSIFKNSHMRVKERESIIVIIIKYILNIV